MHKFKFFAVNGMDEVEIEADVIKLVCENGQKFELQPRKSDGEVVLSANHRLSIRPMAANCVRITDER